MAMLRRSFSLAPGGEYSIEVDPRTVDEGRLAVLAELGFNRLSFGVQDFDPAVQKPYTVFKPQSRCLRWLKRPDSRVLSRSMWI